jgi:hypothetical protein
MDVPSDDLIFQQELEYLLGGVWDDGAEDRGGAVLIEIVVVLGGDAAAADDDNVAAPSRSRAAIALALGNTLSKRDSRLPKKHGNIPL